MSENENIIDFNLPKHQSSVIKVIGIGGGGGNAINYMYENGIEGVDFAVCNTDTQALEASPIPVKIQLGENLTNGLGAGSNPEVGMQAAVESIDRIMNSWNRILICFLLLPEWVVVPEQAQLL